MEYCGTCIEKGKRSALRIIRNPDIAERSLVCDRGHVIKRITELEMKLKGLNANQDN